MKSLLIYITLFSSLSVVAQENLTLSDAIQIGLEKNYSIQISKKEVDIASNNNTWGNAGRLPSVNLIALSNNKLEDAPSQIPGVDGNLQSNTNYLRGSLALDWTIFSGFAVNITKDNLELLEQFSEGNSAIIVENSVQAIILSYYRVLLEQERLDVLNTVMQLSKDRYNYWLTRQEIGNTSSYEVLQAKTDFLSDSTNYLSQQMILNSSQHQLNNLMGVDVATKYTLTDEFLPEVKIYELGDLISKMNNNNKTLQNQYINQNLIKNNINLSKSLMYPRISMSTGYNNAFTKVTPDGYDATDFNSYDFYANFTLSFNLYNGGNTRRAIQNAKISEEIGTIRIDEIKYNLSSLLYNQFDLYNVRRQLYLVSEENLKSADLNLQLSEEKYRIGAITSFNYRDIQIRYLSIAASRLQAIYELISTDTELLRLTGGIITE